MARLSRKVQEDRDKSTLGPQASSLKPRNSRQTAERKTATSASVIDEVVPTPADVDAADDVAATETETSNLQADIAGLSNESLSFVSNHGSIKSVVVRNRSVSCESDSLIKDLAGLVLKEPEVPKEPKETDHGLRRSPRKFAGKTKQQVKQHFFRMAESHDSEEGEEGSETEQEEGSDLSDFIVDDSASESELKRPGKIKTSKPVRKAKDRPVEQTVEKTPRRLVRRSPIRAPSVLSENTDDEVCVGGPVGTMPDFSHALKASYDPDESEKENRMFGSKTNAKTESTMIKLGEQLTDMLRLAPPMQESGPDDGGTPAATPPQSPSRPRLNSPARNRINIPQSPHRQSIDAFWDQNNINDWNDQHSPKKKARAKNALLPIFLSPKKLGSPKKLNLESDSEELDSDDDFSRSPGKKTIADLTNSSPTKKNTDASENPYMMGGDPFFKKKGRYTLARDFLAVLIERVSVKSIGDGSISRIDGMTYQGTGVEIVWSKALQTTAGRANVKRQPKLDRRGRKVSIMKIELAEKIIDRPEYLLNTLAHEFAHLCNMAEDMRAPAHGTGFKKWSRRIEMCLKQKPLPKLIQDLGVEIHITTKHTYEIDYKYVWACMECGKQVGRHSKSIQEHAVHTVDGGKLILIKPRPRNVAKAADGTQSPNAWEVFRKENYGIVKAELSEGKASKATMAEVMAVLSERWQQHKAEGGLSPSEKTISETSTALGLDVDATVDIEEPVLETVDISDDDEADNED